MGHRTFQPFIAMPGPSIEQVPRSKESITTSSKRPSRIPAQTNKKKESVVILGDSIVKNIIGPKLSSQDANVKVLPFSGAKAGDMSDYASPTLKTKPDSIILHVGTNNLKSKDSPDRIQTKVSELAKEIKSKCPQTKLAISSIIKRDDDKSLNSKIDKLNSGLQSMCQSNNFDFISNDNIGVEHLNNSKLHLNKKGSALLASNFRRYIRRERNNVNLVLDNNNTSTINDN